MEKPNLTTSLSPFKKELVTAQIPEGTILLEIFKDIPESYHTYFSVEINGEFIPQSKWGEYKVKKEDILLVYVRPHGGGNNEKNRMIALVAITVAAMYFPPALGFEGFQAALFSAGIATVGGLLVNQIFPIKPPSVHSPSEVTGNPMNSLSAGKNSPAPYNPLPKLYGTRRITPPFAMNPKVILIGNTQYMDLVYFLNYGPIEINGHRIGVYANGNQIPGAKTLIYYDTGIDSSTERVDLDELIGVENDGKETITVGDTGVSLLNPDSILIGTADRISDKYGVDSELIQPNISLLTSVFKMISLSRFNNGKDIKLYIPTPKKYRDWWADNVDTDNNIPTGDPYDGRPDYIAADTVKESSEIDVFKDGNKYNSIEFSYKIESGGPCVFQVVYTTINDPYNTKFATIDASTTHPTIHISNLDVDVFVAQVSSGETWVKGVVAEPGDYIKTLKFYAARTETQTEYRDTIIKFESIKFINADLDVIPVRTTPENSTSAEVHVYSEAGIYSINSRGDPVTARYSFGVYYKPVGAPIEDATYVGDISLSGNSKNPVRVMIPMTFPHAGAYDVGLIFAGASGVTGNDFESITWAFLQCYQNTTTKQLWGGDSDDPRIDKYPVLAFLRLKASEKFNGVIDNVSFYVKGLAFFNDEESSSTPYLEVDSGNPAAAFYDSLTGPQIVKPLSNEKIDIDELADWYIWCESSSCKFRINEYFTEKETLWQRLTKIASVGLASPYISGSKFTVIRDKPGLPASQVITPRNSWGLKASKDFSKLPHAAKMKYTDPNTWEEALIIVYNNNYETNTPYNQYTATDFIEITNYAITDEEQAKRYAMYMLADISLRPEKYTVNMDVENIVVEPGDKVILSYDTVKLGQTYGRIKKVNIIGATVFSVEVDEPVETGYGKSILIRHAGSNGVITNIKNAVPTSETHITIPQGVSANEVSEGDLFIYGDTDTTHLECKVQSISYDKDLTATLTLVNAADDSDSSRNIHQTYLSGNIPWYKPIISKDPNILKSYPPKPIIKSITDELYIVNGEAQKAIRVTFEFPSSPVPISSVTVSASTANSPTIHKSIDPYVMGIYEIYVYPVTPNTTYNITLRSTNTGDTWGTKKTSSSSSIYTTGNLIFEIPAPSYVNFKKDAYKPITVQWAAVTYPYPITYKIIRIDTNGNAVAEYTSSINELVLDDYFTSDSFAVIGVASINGSVVTGVQSKFYQCPYSDPQFKVSDVEYTETGAYLIIENTSDVNYIQYEVRKGYNWDSATPVTSATSNRIKLPIQYGLVDTHNLLILGITDRGGIGQIIEYTLTIDQPYVTNISYDAKSTGVSLNIEYYSQFPIKEVTWKYGGLSDNYNTASLLGVTSLPKVVDSVPHRSTNYYYFIKFKDAMGNESQVFKYNIVLGEPNKPVNIGLKFDSTTNNAILYWEAPVEDNDDLPIVKYEISYKGNIYYTNGTSFNLPTLENNSQILVSSVDVLGNISEPVSYNIVISIPDKVTNFIATQNGESILFDWAPVTNTIIKGYEIRRDSWQLGTKVGFYTTDNAIIPITKSGEVTFYIKALSALDTYSSEDTSITLNVFPSLLTNKIQIYDGKQENWSGGLYNFNVDETKNELVVSNQQKDIAAFTMALMTYNAITRSKNYHSMSILASNETNKKWEDLTIPWEEATFPYEDIIDTPFPYYLQFTQELPTKDSTLYDLYWARENLISNFDNEEATTGDPNKLSYTHGVFHKGLKTDFKNPVTFNLHNKSMMSLFIKVEKAATYLGYLTDVVSVIYFDLMPQGLQIRDSNYPNVIPLNISDGDHLLLGIRHNTSNSYTIFLKNIYENTEVIKDVYLSITNLGSFTYGG